MEKHAHSVTTADGVRIAFDQYREVPRKTALLLCPGFFQSKNTDTFRRLACDLAGPREVICMDFRGHGSSGGWFTFSTQEPNDLRAVLAWMSERYEAISIMGFSMGGVTSLLTVGSDWPKVRSLITVGAPADVDKVEFRWWTARSQHTGLHGLEKGAGVRPGARHLPKQRPVDRVASLAGRPVLIIHGKNDDTVDVSHARQLAEKAGEPKRLVVFEEEGHAEEIYRHAPDAFLTLVQDWLDQTVGDGSVQEEAQPVQMRQGYLKIADGRFLHTREWTPAAALGGPIVLVHGAGEHSGRYDRLARELAAQGYGIFAMDLPGHGTSPGKRGHLRLGDAVDALARFIDKVAEEQGQKPVLIGHSLGGLVSTLFAADKPQAIRGLVLSSPLWGLSVRVPAWKQFVAKLLVPFVPSLTMRRPRHSGFVLSHDPIVKERYFHDPLVHFRASIGFYRELLETMARLPEVLKRLTVPLLVLQAGDERIASADAVRELFPLAASPHKRLRIFDGWYHEVFNEIDRSQAIDELRQWLHALPAEARNKGAH